MTSKNGNQHPDVTGYGLDEAKLSRTLDLPTAEQLQTELNDFVIHTRLRLNSLSQSLAECQSRDRETTMETESNASVNANQIEIMQASTEQLATRSADAAMTVTQPSCAAFVPSNLNPPSLANASTDQLSAIKLRLAQQIKNFS